MSFSLTNFKKSLSSVFDQIEKDQSEAISIQVSANFVAGMTAAEAHKSTIPLKSASPDEPEDPEVEEDGLTTEEKAEIAILVALYLGYLKGFNERAQAQILAEVEGMVTAGQTQEEIKQYVDDIFSGKEVIVIDNVGKERKEIYVDKNLKLSEVTKIVEKPFYATVETYAAMLGANAAHGAYEKGKEIFNRSIGLDEWIFSGPADERARPHHIILIGEVFTWNTEQSAYAERILQEPRCRHRAVPFYNDERDVKKEVWDKLKEESGVFWNEELNKWDIK